MATVTVRRGAQLPRWETVYASGLATWIPVNEIDWTVSVLLVVPTLT